MKLKLQTNKEEWNAIILGDPHFYGKNPLCRKDNLVETQFIKLSEIKEISNNLNLPVICVGDLTNSPYISYGLFSALSEFLQKFKYGFYLVYGQHDLWFHNMDSYESTALGALEKSNIVKRISEFKNDYVYGFDFANWDEDIHKLGNRFLLTHKPVVPKLWVQKFDWLRATQGERKYYFFEDLCNDYELIICGDWHRRYLYSTVNKHNRQSILINPGSMTRREANQDSQNTFPSYVLVNFKTLQTKVVPFSCAEDFDKVISTSHLELSKYQSQITKDLIEYMRTIKLTDKDRSKYVQYLMKCIEISKMPKTVLNLLKELVRETFGSKIQYEAKPTRRLKLRSE